MSFKDQLIADLDSVFFNDEEFASDHFINGYSVRCVVDDNTNQERSYSKADGLNDGVFVAIVTVYLKTSDFAYRPVQGEQLTLDNQGYLVVSTSESDGMLEIKLQANQA